MEVMNDFVAVRMILRTYELSVLFLCQYCCCLFELLLTNACWKFTVVEPGKGPAPLILGQTKTKRPKKNIL